MIQQAQHLLLNDTINFYNVHKYLLSSDLNPWEKKEWIAGIRGEWMDVVLSRIAFGILRTNRVPPDIFRHFWRFFTDFHGFLLFSPFTARFFRLRCAPAQNRDAYHKNVRWTAKRREIREKPSKTVGKCRVAPDWYVKCGKWCSTIQQVQNQFLFLIFNFNFNF